MFTHLHFHTSYSFLDGFNSIQKAVARVKELGMTACAITDHNILCGCPEFQEECEANGIKPILGYEGYFTPSIAEASKPVEERNQDAINRAIEAGVIEDPAHPENIRVEVAQKYIEDHHLDSQACHDFAKEDPFYDYVPSSKKTLQKIHKLFGYDMRQYHILFLAKNQKGWKNLVKLQSESARLCTYNGRFLCDMELIDKYHEGIICTNACIGSYSAKCIERGDEKGAEDYILAMQEIFGDDFYLEIQPLNIKKQHKVNLFYMEMAKKHGIKTVATNDVHYTRKEDYNDHDTLLCIGTGKKKSDVDRMRYSHDFWIKSEEEMYESFAHQQISMEEKSKIDLKEYQLFYTEALKNTSLIADKVETGIRLGSEKPLFSNVRVPHGLTPEKWLTILAYKGMYKYLAKHPEYDVHEYENRMVEELAIINGKGFAPYMLAVKEYVTWANENNCPTGPGRGSAAGSLALFSIGVTKNIDPIQNQLLFSRFLTADRKDPPDVDVDFEYTHRDDVIEHLKDYYGEPNVAHIGTYTLMGVKSGIKDVGRVLEVDYKIVDSITKKIDEINDAPGAKFKDFDAMKEGDENERKAWETFHELEENHQELFRLARTFEGTPRGMGVHASGILVTPMPVSNIFPIRYKDGVAVTLYTGPQLEHYNSIKYDFLGLKTISIITKAIAHIDDIKDINDLYEKADIDDKNIWKYISEKQTEGVFQVESDMMKGIIEMIQPTSFDDLGAINALGRPGPLSAGLPQQYGGTKNGDRDVEYPIRGCEDILDSTYGGTIYQEQLMMISKKVSGFDDMQADSITRKVLGKKKIEMFPMMKRCHIYGKKNCEGPAGWEDDMHAPWYDPKGKYGKEIPGALVNGYTEEELLAYFDKIEGFAKYAFNKSHSACYAYIGFLTAWLKYYYPAEFMAAVLSMQDTPEKIAKYVDVCESKLKIAIKTPDINISGIDFTPDGNSILYGLGSVKSVGAAAVPVIIEHRPYANVADAVARLPKKAFNKRIGENLIKAGAFDFEDENRFSLLNSFYDARKDKKVQRYAVDAYSKDDVIEMEKEALGSPITYKPWWDGIAPCSRVVARGSIRETHERKDRRGRLMAFPNLVINKCEVSGLIFASNYAKCALEIDAHYLQQYDYEFEFIGKKDEKGKFIINSVQAVRKEEDAA